MKFNEFIVMRHSYDDHSYIDGKNDTSLTSDGIKIAKDAAEIVVQNLDERNIIVRYSSKKRAKETAEILCQKISKMGLSYTAIEDKNLNELFQGNLNFKSMQHKEKVDFLQSCWDDFERNRNNGNLKYRFGEKKDSDIVILPGETHLEWSFRMGNAVLSILNDIVSENQVIGITHRGAMFEIQNLIKMVNSEISFDEVEKYKTIWMKYCQDYLLRVNDLEKAKKRIKDYIEERSL